MNQTAVKIYTTDEIEVGARIHFGDRLVEITKIVENSHGELVWHVNIVGATTKKRSKAMIIIPKKVPFTTER